MEPKTFEAMTGTPADVLSQWGCLGVVDSALGIAGGKIPEFPGNLPPHSTECWWGNGQNVEPAKKKACDHKCPPSTRKVIWCKQGYLADGIHGGTPGTYISDPAGIWDNSGGLFNYSVYNPTTDTFTGADVAGGAGGYTSPGQPWGTQPAENGAMCCATCLRK